MVFDFLKGEFIDVISWLDDTRDTMVWRFDRRGQAIKMGAKLTVREGQAAVFIHEGQLVKMEAELRDTLASARARVAPPRTA